MVYLCVFKNVVPCNTYREKGYRELELKTLVVPCLAWVEYFTIKFLVLPSIHINCHRIGVSTTKTCLNTSDPATINMDQSEYEIISTLDELFFLE